MKKDGETIGVGTRYCLIVTGALAMVFLTSLTACAGPPPMNDPSGCAHAEEWPLYVRLTAGTFDPVAEEPVIPKALELHCSSGYYIVQFRGPLDGRSRSVFGDMVGDVIGYIPDYSFLVKMSHEEKERVEELPQVRWIGEYHPAYKIQPGLLEMEGEVELNIIVFDDDPGNLQTVRDELVCMGGTITYSGHDNNIIRVRISASRIRDIAFISEIQWMDEYRPPIGMMDNVREFTGANTLHLNGYDGTGIVGEVKDSGIDLDHPDFTGQLIGTDGFVTDEPHGTCTFGIVFSSGANNSQAEGMLPGGEGVFCTWDVSRTSSISNLVNTWGGVFQSNSWGEGWEDSTYTSDSRENDEAVLDYDVVMLYAAGNSHFGVSPQSCSRDSIAKNVIAVGALWHSDNTDWDDDQWANLGPGMTPSQGPASDGRIKPDLSGPFDYIYTTDSTDGDGEDGYAPGDYYHDMGGTSGATPVTAGAVGLVYQMYRNNHFGNNPSGVMPHASTVKALLIADAHQYDFSQANRYQQGWGGVDVGNVHAIGENHLIVDEERPLITGESAHYSIMPTGTGPLKISLVWTDVPGTTSSSQHLINDLNLKVTDPGGTVYRGNHNLDTSKWSSSGGSPDTLNNVENVFVETPTLGTWTVEIDGAHIPMDGHSSTTDIDQAFALVASNVVETFRVDIDSPGPGEQIHDTVNITGTSAGGISSVEVRIDSGPWETAAGTTNWYHEWDTRLFSDGNHTVYARGFNGTLYSETQSVTVFVDNTPPTTSIFIGEPRFINGQRSYVSVDTQFTLTADDGTGSGVNATMYSIHLEGIEVAHWTSGDCFSLSWGEGNYTIFYHSEDAVGNTDDTDSLDVYLDSSPPNTELDVGAPRHAENSSDIWNVTSDTFFTLLPSDEWSGLNVTWYTIDGVLYTGLGFDLLGYDDGPRTITWGSLDNVGNNETSNTIVVNLDNSPPETAMDIDGTKYRAADDHSWNVTAATRFTLVPFDQFSGLDIVYFTIDGVYHEGFNFTLEGLPDGLHLISWGGHDNLGNAEEENQATIYLDTTPPRTEMTIGEPRYRPSPTGMWSVTKETMFDLIPADEHARVRTVWYTINGTYYEDGWLTLKFHSDGLYALTWGGIDNLGHNETGNSITVNLDSQPPDVDITIGEPKYRKEHGHCWNVTPATPFSLIPYDSNVGIDTTWYTITSDYHEGLLFDMTGYEEGYYLISWGAADHLGNEAQNRTLSVYLNKFPPVTWMDIEGKRYRRNDGDCLNVSDMTGFILSPIETRTGINATWFEIDGLYLEGSYFKFAEYIEGIHVMRWGSRNNLGQNETTNSLTLCLDISPPHSDLTVGYPRYRAGKDDLWTVTEDTVFSLTSRDNHTGVAFTWYTIHGIYFVGTNFTLEGFEGRIHKVTWGSQDNLGYNSSANSMRVYSDNTPPETSIAFNQSYLYSDGVTYVNTSATVSLYAYDGSGVGTSFTWYSLDGGETYSVYTGPFTLPLGTTSILYGSRDNLGNNATPAQVMTVVDETDTDLDGIYDAVDEDDDADGILDHNDAFPLDTDNDGEENSLDADDDADGVIDEEDQFPLDTDNDAVRNDLDGDDDGDGIDDIVDMYLLDTDNDGIRNDADPDDDGDGLDDSSEVSLTTHPLKADTDGDGRGDGVDAFPLDPDRWEEEGNDVSAVFLGMVLMLVSFTALFAFYRMRKKDDTGDE